MLLKKGHSVSGASPTLNNLPEPDPRSPHPSLASTEETSVITTDLTLERGEDLVNELAPECSTHSPHTAGETEAEKFCDLTSRRK